MKVPWFELGLGSGGSGFLLGGRGSGMGAKCSPIGDRDLRRNSAAHCRGHAAFNAMDQGARGISFFCSYLCAPVIRAFLKTDSVPGTSVQFTKKCSSHFKTFRAAEEGIHNSRATDQPQHVIRNTPNTTSELKDAERSRQVGGWMGLVP